MSAGQLPSEIREEPTRAQTNKKEAEDLTEPGWKRLSVQENKEHCSEGLTPARPDAGEA